jgi:N6-adenosine-specific RNA methylase IME4
MYEVLYADPCWDYDGREQHNTKTANKSVKHHYDTLTTETLKTLTVESITAPNAVLFLWTSSPHLDQAIDLMKAWGFAYKTIAFVWDKQKVNPGYYTMSQCEVCLVGKKGTIPTPRGTRNERQFLSQMRGRHSAKPDEIRKRIERMFPTQKKLELFAREKVEGWDAWGNEVESSISLSFNNRNAVA